MRPDDRLDLRCPAARELAQGCGNNTGEHAGATSMDNRTDRTIGRSGGEHDRDAIGHHNASTESGGHEDGVSLDGRLAGKVGRRNHARRMRLGDPLDSAGQLVDHAPALRGGIVLLPRHDRGQVEVARLVRRGHPCTNARHRERHRASELTNPCHQRGMMGCRVPSESASPRASAAEAASPAAFPAGGTAAGPDAASVPPASDRSG